MITVPIMRAKPKGKGSYHSIILMLPWYNYFIHGAQTSFQEIKKKVAKG